MKSTLIFFLICHFITLIKSEDTSVTVCLEDMKVCLPAACVPGTPNQVCTVTVCNDDSIICQNGGVCVLNDCYCPSEFFGSRCEFSASDLNNISTSTDVSVAPTGLLGLDIGYPLYLTLIIPSVGVTAIIICHICLLCCIPALVACRLCGKRKSQKRIARLGSRRMAGNETQSHQLNLQNITNLENHHVSILHDYTDMNITTHVESPPATESYQEMNNPVNSFETRPLPPRPPVGPRDRIQNLNIPLKPSHKIIPRQSCEYSYPFVTFMNNKGNGGIVGVAKVRRSVTEENNNPVQAEVVSSRESGYTNMEPKYVIQQHDDRNSVEDINNV
ncbi:hypothetical protein LOD99_436 [Oopsacas minuta]|uniref:EGF-like domain-containing protein n=1 Tax=Oopsacas minuta TaxID=111878 RepID=A0AAV7K8X5_9METZ|nr:hypothetical protein LOD99_436 [Oopsacas minuta]